MLSRVLRSRPFLSVALVIVLGSIGVAIFNLVGHETVVPTTTIPPTTTSLPTTTSTSSSTTTTTTTTTLAVFETSFVNGLPVDDPSLLDRRVLAVKIDNHYLARPQSGIDSADMVVELMVEGITRFMTIWQQSDTDYLGPVRSGRPTDPTLLQAFNEPTFALSGAQDWVQNLIRSKNVHLVGEVHPATFRISSRSAPHDLYANTGLLREYADGLGYPDAPPVGPIWEFGPMAPVAATADSVRLDFSGNIVRWEWDEATGEWLRFVGGNPSEWRNQEGETGQISRPVLVALYVEQYTAYPAAGQSGTPVPAERTTGTGKAFVFADGKVIEGTWERRDETDWFLLRDRSGKIIPVPPGKVWVSLVPNTTGLTWK